MKTTKEKIEVMQAHEKGTKIEFKVVEDCGSTNPDPEWRVLPNPETTQWDWLHKDYRIKPDEPVVDWTKIPENTPVLVRHRLDSFWAKRYFKKYAEGVFEVFGCGSTSRFVIGIEKWKYAKLDLEADNLLCWIPNLGFEPAIGSGEICLVRFTGGSISKNITGLDWRLTNNIASYAIIKP